MSLFNVDTEQPAKAFYSQHRSRGKVNSRVVLMIVCMTLELTVPREEFREVKKMQIKKGIMMFDVNHLANTKQNQTKPNKTIK